MLTCKERISLAVWKTFLTTKWLISFDICLHNIKLLIFHRGRNFDGTGQQFEWQSGMDGAAAGIRTGPSGRARRLIIIIKGNSHPCSSQNGLGALFSRHIRCALEGADRHPFIGIRLKENSRPHFNVHPVDIEDDCARALWCLYNQPTLRSTFTRSIAEAGTQAERLHRMEVVSPRR